MRDYSKRGNQRPPKGYEIVNIGTITDKTKFILWRNWYYGEWLWRDVKNDNIFTDVENLIGKDISDVINSRDFGDNLFANPKQITVK